MKFSFSMFGTDAEDMVRIARRADELGFDTLWLGDHMLRPAVFAPYTEGWEVDKVLGYDTPLWDPWAVLGHLAAHTERIRLATGVYILPLRNPFVTARAVGTVHALSRGRVIFGVGAGWNRQEFEIVGAEFTNRGRRMDEMLDVLRRLWAGESFSFDGEFYEFEEVRLGSPLVPEIPIVMGGSTPPALRRAARVGDGWYSTGEYDIDQLVQMRTHIDAMRDEFGRGSRPFTYYVLMNGPLDAENAARYRAAGFEHLSLQTQKLWREIPDVEGRLEHLEQLAADLEIR